MYKILWFLLFSSFSFLSKMQLGLSCRVGPSCLCPGTLTAALRHPVGLCAARWLVKRTAAPGTVGVTAAADSSRC